MDLVSNRRSIALAVIALVAWMLAIAGLWFAGERLFPDPDLAVFIGRFHILIIHLPIGLLIAALAFEALSVTGLFPRVGENVIPALWLGALGAIGASVAGYLLMSGEGIEGKDMTRHLWTGLGVVVLAFVCLWLKLGRVPRLVTLPALAATVALTGASSHFGGNMVHGNDYLSEHAPEPLKPFLGHPEPTEVVEAPDMPFEQWSVYERIIQPIFNGKCTECHDENKIEGGLRMDSFEQLALGGEMVKDGDIPGEFVPGDSEGSELIYRVTIDPSEDDFMPPGNRDHLSGDEITLLKWWIDLGASPTMTVSEAGADETVARVLDELKARAKS